jgi:hypothetical protein
VTVSGRPHAAGARRRPAEYVAYEAGRRRTPGTPVHPAHCARTYESGHEMVDSAGFVDARPGGGWRRPTCASRREGWRSQPEIVESII